MGFLGGGLFGSGAKENTGNTHTLNKTMHSADLIEDNTGFINSVRLNEGQGAVITMTDYGALDSATKLLDKGVDTIANTVNDVMNIITGVSMDNKAVSEYAISEVVNSSTNTLIAAEKFADNNAYLTESAISGNLALTSQFGGDVAYLADTAMTNNAILTDSVIGTVENLATEHNEALENYGSQLKDAQAQYSADVGFLSGQSIQANAELTSRYMEDMYDNNLILKDSLLTLANLQQEATHDALDVAGNVALDDSVEGFKAIFKYLSIAAGIVGVAYYLGGNSK